MEPHLKKYEILEHNKKFDIIFNELQKDNQKEIIDKLLNTI